MQAQCCSFNILILFRMEYSHAMFLGKKKERTEGRKEREKEEKEGGRESGEKKTGIRKKKKRRSKQL